MATGAARLIFLDGTQIPVDGHALNFAAGNLYVVNIGNVGDGSAAAVAQAANKAYVVADTHGVAITALRGGMGGITEGEHLTFMGRDDSGNAEYWFFGSVKGAVGAFVPATSLFGSADVNGNHQVDPGEITHLPDILGVIPAAGLVLGDLGG